MKFLCSKKIICFVFFSLFYFQSYAETSGLGYLPESWYKLPEDRSTMIPKSLRLKKENEGEKLKSVSGSIQNILYSNEKALNEIKEKEGERWYLDNIRTQLAVGASGLVGIMTMKGSGSVRLYWKPKKVTIEKPVSPSTNSLASEYDLAFSTEMKKEEVVKTLEPVIEHALASGRIKKREKFKRNLSQAATEFHSIVSGSQNYSQGSNWYVNGFMVEIYVTASGDVTPFAEVGAELRIRFIWIRVRKKQSDLIPKSLVPRAENKLLTNTRSKLTGFLSNMIQDLDLASREQIDKTSFELEKFRVGVGVGVKGSIAAAKVKSRVYFYVMFRRSKNKSIVKSLNRDKGESFISIVSNRNENEMRYAKQHNIPFEIESVPKSLRNKKATTSVIYKIKRKHFRKGLIKAYKMTNYFAKEVAEKPRKKWYVYHVETHFELSMTGGLGLASLTGVAAARMNFYKR